MVGVTALVERGDIDRGGGVDREACGGRLVVDQRRAGGAAGVHGIGVERHCRAIAAGVSHDVGGVERDAIRIGIAIRSGQNCHRERADRAVAAFVSGTDIYGSGRVERETGAQRRIERQRRAVRAAGVEDRSCVGHRQAIAASVGDDVGREDRNAVRRIAIRQWQNGHVDEPGGGVAAGVRGVNLDRGARVERETGVGGRIKR